MVALLAGHPIVPSYLDDKEPQVITDVERWPSGRRRRFAKPL